MSPVRIDQVRIAGICSCVPATRVDNFARCVEIYGDRTKAESIVKTTGIRSRRVLGPGQTALGLCTEAARRVFAKTQTAPAEIGAVVSVTFTPDRLMPASACRVQAILGLEKDVLAFDLNLACSGWPYGVFVAGLLAKATGRKVLLLDGDAQTARTDPKDEAMVPLLADAGTATILEPSDSAAPFAFAFLTDGAKGDALQLPFGGTIAMDGFAVFKFATMDVLKFLQEFLASAGKTSADFDAFVPHQANMFMIEQIAKKLGFAEKLGKSGDVLGNSSSASVPTTIAHTQARGRLLVAGFGGGLSAAVADLSVDAACELEVAEL